MTDCLGTACHKGAGRIKLIHGTVLKGTSSPGGTSGSREVRVETTAQ
jgi:hypothetical protein